MRHLLQSLGALRKHAKREHTLRMKFPGLTLEQFVVVKGDFENLVVRGKVKVQSGTVLHLGGNSWCERVGHFEIGDGSCISPNCTLYGAGPGGLRIGRNFDCGPGVGIFASRTDYELGPHHHVFAPVTIGDDVTVFANAVISPGVTLGDRAVVAAGAVVTDDVPAGALVGGAPARVIRPDVRREAGGAGPTGPRAPTGSSGVRD